MRAKELPWFVVAALLGLAIAGCNGSSKNGKETTPKLNKVQVATEALAQAIEAEEQGQPNVAERKYARALKLRPKHFKTAERYTQFLIKQKRANEAVKVASQFLSRSLGELAAYHLLADAQLKARDWIGAQETLTELIELDGGDAKAWQLRGEVQVRRKSMKAGLKDLRKAVELAPESPDVHAALGAALAQKGRDKEAAIELRKAIKLDSRHGRAHWELGKVLRDQHEYEDALEMHKKAVKFSPDSARSHFELGISQVYVGDNPGAEISLKKATELDPGDPINWYVYGEVMRNMKRWGDAVRYYKKALQVDPNYTKAADKLGVVLYYAGDLAEAEAILTDRVKSHPDEPYAYFNLGQVYAKAKKYRLAIGVFEKFIELAPKGDGDIDKARQQIRALRRKAPPRKR